MKLKSFAQVVRAGLLISVTTATTAVSTLSSPPLKTINSYQTAAAKFDSIVTLPEFETTPEAVKKSADDTITGANARLDQVGRLNSGNVTFENTVRALDDIGHTAGMVENRIYLIKETSTNAVVREAAAEMIKKFEEWSVSLDYREDVYKSVKTFGDSQPKLTGEDARLLEETLRDYRRAGLHLSKAQRDEIEGLRKEETRLATDFQSNITQVQSPVKFTRAELEGVPESLLETPGLKTGPDEYTLRANVTFHALAVAENAKREETRKRFATIRNNLAREPNAPLLQKLVELRDQIAHQLGYASWADYQIEPRMAKNARTAREFLQNLKAGLQPKFDAELAEFQKLKAADTGDPNAKIHSWDVAYYSNQLKKQKYSVDGEQLRVFFPYEQVLKGMFDIYQSLFSLTFQEITPPYQWVDDLKLFAVSDAVTGEPLGFFYLDMFPREGKYNHFAQFPIVPGKLLPNGKYQRPVVALVCNFPPPQPGKPSLLSHDEVETVFHEFGHAMHTLLTRAHFSRFSGTSVPRDFVEAPSQMLENWIWDKKVLDTFAADYRDPSKKIPPEILAQLKASRLAVEGSRYRRQLALGLTDLALHTQVHGGAGVDCIKLANQIQSDVFLPAPEDTAFIAYFGHLAGYDAGYYGYAWADAISADMATVFENSPDGFLDTGAGMRLRNEIYAPGNSRDVNESIRRFLGREQSIKPFLKQIGVETR